MKQNNIISRILIALFVITTFTMLSGCIEEQEPDACDNSIAAQKVINVIALVHIEDVNGVAVDSVNINVDITYLPCGTDDADPTLFENTVTDSLGNYVSDNANIVMNNTEDRIKVTAIAPDLDYYQKNYETKYFKYAELSGTGQEEVELIIYQNAK